MLADLHIHTTYSDSTLTPSEVVRWAERKGLSHIAITDHDVTDGIAEAEDKTSVVVIPGIEIECDSGRQNEEIHILGYFIKRENQRLQRLLSAIREGRRKRIDKILEKLKRAGISLNISEVKKVAGPGAIGRLHIAYILYLYGFSKSVLSAFERFLTVGKPGWVEREMLPSPKVAIDVIRDAGGIPVLAHPYNFIGTIPRLVEAGILGIEVIHPRIDPVIRGCLVSRALKYDLLITGGSDCHGEMKGGIEIGKRMMDEDMLYRFLEKAKEYGCAI
jgi:hypothetical protein